MGTAVSVGPKLGATLTVVGAAGGVCVGADTAAGVESGKLQAEVRARNPIRKNLFFIECSNKMEFDQQYNCWSNRCGDAGN